MNLKLGTSKRPVLGQHMIFLLFTLTYLIIQLKINLLILFKEPSKGKALLTLHVTTEARGLRWNSHKYNMHGLVKMYVMR